MNRKYYGLKIYYSNLLILIVRGSDAGPVALSIQRSRFREAGTLRMLIASLSLRITSSKGGRKRMPENKDNRYIITYDQLMDLIMEKDLNKKQALIILIVSQKYHDKTFMEALCGAIRDGLVYLDKITDPAPKKGGKGP
jgi:hypothetical protein